MFISINNHPLGPEIGFGVANTSAVLIDQNINESLGNFTFLSLNFDFILKLREINKNKIRMSRLFCMMWSFDVMKSQLLNKIRQNYRLYTLNFSSKIEEIISAQGDMLDPLKCIKADLYDEFNVEKFRTQSKTCDVKNDNVTANVVATSQNNFTWIHERIFYSSKHDGTRLPRWLRTLTFSDVIPLLKSLFKYQPPSPTNQDEIIKLREFSRSLNYVYANWHTDHDSLCDFLVDLYCKDSVVPKSVPRREFTFSHYFYVSHPVLKIPNFELKHFMPKNAFPPLLEESFNLGLIGLFVEQASNTSNHMTIQKIKAIIKECIQNKMDCATTISLFAKKCKLWKYNECLFVCQSHLYSWFVPYIPPHFLTLSISNETYFWNLFHSIISTFRGRVYEYVSNFYRLASMTNRERKDYKKQIKLEFIGHMRNPVNQGLFLMGVPKQDIVDKIFTNDMVNQSAKNAKYYRATKSFHNRKRLRQRNISQNRDSKLFIETESQYYCRKDAEIYPCSIDEFNCQSYPNNFIFGVVLISFLVSCSFIFQFGKVYAFWYITGFCLCFYNWYTFDSKCKFDIVTESDTEQVPAGPYVKPYNRPRSFMRLPFIEQYFEEEDVDTQTNDIKPPWYSRLIPVTAFVQFCITYPLMIGYSLLVRYIFPDAINTFMSTMTFAYNTKEKMDAAGNAFSNYLLDWKKYCIDSKKFPISAENKIIAVEIKAAIHTFYYAYHGCIKTAAGHASYFALTRPDMIMSLLNYADNGILRKFVSPEEEDPKCITHEYQGKLYVMSADEWGIYCRIHEDPYAVEQFFSHLTEKTDNVHTESLGDVANTLGSLFGLFQITNMSPNEVRHANQQFAYINNTSRMMTDKLGIVSKLISYICRVWFGVDPFDPEVVEYAESIIKMIDKILIISRYTNTQLVEKHIGDDVYNTWDQANVLRKNPRYVNLPLYTAQRYADMLKDLRKVVDVVDGLRGCKERDTPQFVLFTGPPEVGKTCGGQVMRKMIHRMHQRAEPDKFRDFDNQKDVYVVNSNDPYPAMSFNDQLQAVIEDLFMKRDKESLSKEAENLLGFVNTERKPLEAADIEHKGKVFFTCKYIFASTNIANKGIKNADLECLGMMDSTSILRRFHLCIHREQKVQDDVIDNMWRIDKCDMYPHLENTWVSTTDCSKLIYSCKLKRDSEAKRRDYSMDRIDSLLDNSTFVPETYLDELARKHQLIREEMHLDVSDASTSISERSMTSSDVPSLESEANFQSKEMSERIEYVILEFIRLEMYSWWNSPYVKTIVGVCIFITSLALMYPLFGLLFPKDAFDLDLESNYKKNLTGPKTKKQVNHQTHVRRAEILKMQIKPESDESNYDGALQNIAKSIVHIFCKNYDKDCCDGSLGFHLRDGYFVMTAHGYLMYGSQPDTMFTMTKYDGEVITFIPPTEVIHIDGEDLVIFKCPVKMNYPPAAFKYIIDEKTSMDNPIEHGMSLQLLTRTPYGKTVIKNCTRANMDRTVDYPHKRVKNTRYIIDQPISYWCNSAEGDSGGIVCVMGPQGKPYIVGMHVGGHNGLGSKLGVALPFDQMFLLKSILKHKSDIEKIEPESCPFPLIVKNEVSCGEAFITPSKTKLKKTQMYECFGDNTCFPAHLRPFHNEKGELIDPYILSLKKLHQEFTPAIDISDSIYYLDYLYPRIDNPRLFTFKEALVGVSEEGVTSICYGTSPGYPYCKGPKHIHYEFSDDDPIKQRLLNELKAKPMGKGKGPYIVVLDDDTFEFEEGFLAMLIDMEKKLISGENIEVIWADVLKDERRLMSKVMEGKTRLFATCPLHYLFLVRRYFLNVVYYIQQQCDFKPVCVGINPHSTQWTRLADRLSRTSASIIAGDFSNYDGMIPAFVMKEVLRWINYWYDDGPVNARVRELLFEHIYSAVRIHGTIMYQVADGNPSGNPLTSIVNSLCNIIMTRFILSHIFHLQDDEFELAVYGDDNIISCLVEGLRVSDFTPWYSEFFNLKYTHAEKIEGIDRDDSLETISFISRKFVKHNTLYLAPLPMDTIKEMVYYERGVISHDATILATCRNFLEETFHLGPEEHKKWSLLLLQALKRRCPHLCAAVQQFDYPWMYYYRKNYTMGRSTFLKNLDIDQSEDDNLNEVKIIPESNEYLDLTTSVSTYGEYILPGGVVEIECESSFIDTSHNENFDERAVRELDTTQRTNLGSYEDAAPVYHHVMNPNTIAPYYDTNLEMFDIKKLLEREYVIGVTTWTPVQATGTNLAQISLPDNIFAVQFIADKIKNFRYFRGGFRVTARVSASKYAYGKLILSYNPRADLFPTGFTDNCYQASGFNHLLLSASAAEVGVLDIPFKHFQRFLDINNYIVGELGTINVNVAVPLKDTQGIVDTAKVTLTIAMIEPELFMPFSTASLECESASEKEADIKSQKMSIGSSLSLPLTVKPKMESPSVKGYDNGMISHVTRQGIKDFQIKGLSKPAALNYTQIIKNDPLMGANYGKGMEAISKFAMDPDCSISAMRCFNGNDVDEMDINYICGVPRMINILNIASNAGTFQVAALQMGDYAYVDDLCALFRYWSGDMKYKIYIVASQYHTIKLVFWLADNPTKTAWKECYHRVIDVRGDTNVEWTMPFLDTAIQSTPGVAAWYLMCTILDWSQPDDALSCPIAMMLYKAGSNISVACPMEMMINPESQSFEIETESNPRVDFGVPFEPFHPSMTGYSHSGLVNGEKYTTLKELCSKHHLFGQVSGTDDDYVFNNLGNLNVLTGLKYRFGFEMIAQLFYLFWRGSIVVRMLSKTNTTARSLCFQRSDQNGTWPMQGFEVMNSVKPYMETIVPYYYPTLYQPARKLQGGIRMTSTPSTVGTYYLDKCLADDGQLLELVPRSIGNPPVHAYVYGSTGITIGQAGFRNFS